MALGRGGWVGGWVGGFGSGRRRRRREEGGANIRLIQVEDCSSIILSLNIFLFLYFININSYLWVVRHVRTTHALYITLWISNT
jgi:hypothetical protein